MPKKTHACAFLAVRRPVPRFYPHSWLSLGLGPGACRGSTFRGCCYLQRDLGSDPTGRLDLAIFRSHPQHGFSSWLQSFFRLRSLRSFRSSGPTPESFRTADHKPRRSPTTCAAIPPIFWPRQPRPASYCSSHLFGTAPAPIVVIGYRVPAARECTAPLAPAIVVTSRCQPW